MISARKLTMALATMFQWAAAIVGFLIIGSCGTVGLKASGLLDGAASLLAGIVVAIFVAGWIFLIAGLCKDALVIRERLTGQAEAPVARAVDHAEPASGGEPART